MKKNTKITYLITELFIIFIGVSLAFALQNWSDNNRNKDATHKILLEIKNGLEKDIEDLDINLKGHQSSIRAAQFYTAVLQDSMPITDSIFYHYFYITRDYISIQNRTGYETLKSRGLELIESDSLRKNIISLYDFDFEILEKMEEEYAEMQFTRLFFHKIHGPLSEYYKMDAHGLISDLDYPIQLSSIEKNRILQYIKRIEINRNFMIKTYQDIKQKAVELISLIDETI